MDFVTLRTMLHPDFQMILGSQARIDFPSLGPSLDWEEEVRIAGRMFSGVGVTDPDSNWVAPIGTIDVLVLEQATDWADSGPDVNFPNTQAAMFEVRIVLFRPEYAAMQATGTLRFYAAAKDTVVDGTSQTYWSLLGQHDFTGPLAKASESTSFGQIKGTYR